MNSKRILEWLHSLIFVSEWVETGSHVPLAGLELLVFLYLTPKYWGYPPPRLTCLNLTEVNLEYRCDLWRR